MGFARIILAPSPFPISPELAGIQSSLSEVSKPPADRIQITSLPELRSNGLPWRFFRSLPHWVPQPQLHGSIMHCLQFCSVPFSTSWMLVCEPLICIFWSQAYILSSLYRPPDLSFRRYRFQICASTRHVHVHTQVCFLGVCWGVMH